MGYVLQVLVLKAIKSFCFKIPRFFTQQSRENLSVHGESDDWDLLICSHCEAPPCQSTPPTLTTHLERALPRSTEGNVPLASHNHRYQMSEKTHEGIKLNKGGTIERVPNTQDKLSHFSKHFTSRGQQSG